MAFPLPFGQVAVKPLPSAFFVTVKVPPFRASPFDTVVESPNGKSSPLAHTDIEGSLARV